MIHILVEVFFFYILEYTIGDEPKCFKVKTFDYNQNALFHKHQHSHSKYYKTNLAHCSGIGLPAICVFFFKCLNPFFVYLMLKVGVLLWPWHLLRILFRNGIALFLSLTLSAKLNQIKMGVNRICSTEFFTPDKHKCKL